MAISSSWRLVERGSRRGAVLLCVLAVAAGWSGGCTPGGVGNPCIPEDESKADFSGFAASEVNIESRSFQCETRVCLVNHFRGRVSCPLGQPEALAEKARKFAQARLEDPRAKISDFFTRQEQAMACHLPGESGEQAALVETSVLPQCEARKADDAAYCSCRCDGDDPGAAYCACPEGFVCQKFPELSLGAAVARGGSNLRGSYCVKAAIKEYVEGECPQAVSAQSLADTCTSAGNCGATDNVGGR